MSCWTIAEETEVKAGLFFRNIACFSFNARKHNLLLDYGGVAHMNASVHSLCLLDAAYHRALRFITGCEPLTFHCVLYSLTSWSLLSMCRTTHCYLFIYKPIIGLLPSYLSMYMTQKQCDRSLRSLDYIPLSIHSVLLTVFLSWRSVRMMWLS